MESSLTYIIMSEMRAMALATLEMSNFDGIFSFEKHEEEDGLCSIW